MKFKIEITKGTYNKTKTEDGITHIVDTSKDYTYYEVYLFKRYYDIENKEELEKQLKNDLQKVVNALDKNIEKERND